MIIEIAVGVLAALLIYHHWKPILLTLSGILILAIIGILLVILSPLILLVLIGMGIKKIGHKLGINPYLAKMTETPTRSRLTAIGTTIIILTIAEYAL